MGQILNATALLGFLAIIVGQIWLIVLIMRGSPPADLLCLFFVPFLIIFFISEHWQDAKPAVLCWLGGIFTFLISCCLLSSP